MATDGWIDQPEIKSRESMLGKTFIGRMSGGRMSVYAKKFEILQKETTNWAVLCDCMPVIMDLMTCELNVNKMLLKSVLQNLVQMILSSEMVVKKLSTAWKTDVLMGNLLRVMREHVMTQYKHYQMYMHAAVTVIKCLARVMKKNKAKEYRFIKTTYPVGKDNCTVLDVLLKPMQHMVNMNEMFNDLGFMLLDNEDINCLDEIKRYLTRMFDKIQNKIDVVWDTVDEIVRRHECRCEKKRSVAEAEWIAVRQQLQWAFETVVVKPRSFVLNVCTQIASFFTAKKNAADERALERASYSGNV